MIKRIIIIHSLAARDMVEEGDQTSIGVNLLCTNEYHRQGFRKEYGYCFTMNERPTMNLPANLSWNHGIAMMDRIHPIAILA